MGIGHTTLSKTTTGARGISTDGDVVVAFSTAAYFRNLDGKLQSNGYVGGLDMLERNLTKHLLDCGAKDDQTCMRGKIDINKLTVSQRLHFEFGRIQRAAYNQNWHLNITTMPRTNVKAFTQMPEPIKNQIMILFEASTKFTCT